MVALVRLLSKRQSTRGGVSIETLTFPICVSNHVASGVFADQKKIYKGTYIGIYAGELITEEEGEERGR